MLDLPPTAGEASFLSQTTLRSGDASSGLDGTWAVGEALGEEPATPTLPRDSLTSALDERAPESRDAPGPRRRRTNAPPPRAREGTPESSRRGRHRSPPPRLTFDDPLSFSAGAAEFTPRSASFDSSQGFGVSAPAAAPPRHELEAFFLPEAAETRSLIIVDCVCGADAVVAAANRFGTVSGVDDSRGAPRPLQSLGTGSGKKKTPVLLGTWPRA